MDGGDRLVVVTWPVGLAHPHAAEADGRDLETVAEFAQSHDGSSGRGRHAFIDDGSARGQRPSNGTRSHSPWLSHRFSHVHGESAGREFVIGEHTCLLIREKQTRDRP